MREKFNTFDFENIEFKTDACKSRFVFRILDRKDLKQVETDCHGGTTL